MYSSSGQNKNIARMLNTQVASTNVALRTKNTAAVPFYCDVDVKKHSIFCFVDNARRCYLDIIGGDCWSWKKYSACSTYLYKLGCGRSVGTGHNVLFKQPTAKTKHCKNADVYRIQSDTSSLLLVCSMGGGSCADY